MRCFSRECLFCETLSLVSSQNWDWRHEVSIFVLLKKKNKHTNKTLKKTVDGKCMTQIRRFIFFCLFKADRLALMGNRGQKVRREQPCCCKLGLQWFLFTLCLSCLGKGCSSAYKDATDVCPGKTAGHRKRPLTTWRATWRWQTEASPWNHHPTQSLVQHSPKRRHLDCLDW